MDAYLHTPFGQKLRSVFSATPPSSGRAVTPVSPRFPGKPDMVRRLREQLKSRDEIIMQMQTQILEQSRMLYMDQLRMGDLEELLRTTNRSLFEAEQEIDHLKKTLAESCTCRPASCQVRKRACLCTDEAGAARYRGSSETGRQQQSQKEDMSTLVSEAKRLTDELKLIRQTKRERTNKAGDIALLESELTQARETASKYAALFEECDSERMKLSCALSELQQNLQSQAIKLEQIRAHTTAPTVPETSPQRYESTYSSSVFQSPIASGSLFQSQEATPFSGLISETTTSGWSVAGEDTRAEMEQAASAELGQEQESTSSWLTDEEVSRLSDDMDTMTMLDEKRLDSMVNSSIRLGSPTVTSSGEGSKNSFGGFVFDMEQENQVVLLKRGDETCYRDDARKQQPDHATVEMSPFSKMMTRLDLLKPRTAGVLLTDSLVVAETVERSIGSLDSAFNKVLLNKVRSDPSSNGSRSGSSMSIVVDE